jgi:lipopolysaccharide/colanic/teichoic acid biosynthesis glycosyltransferase
MALDHEMNSVKKWERVLVGQTSADCEEPASDKWRVLESSKAALDFALALLLLVFTAPLVALAALAVKLTSKGPAFYCQIRIGKQGRPYVIYKLRSMFQNCESKSGACWAAPGDARITLVGRFLRRTHIDELPQMWNILRGDMSLVGPRPERPEFVIKLNQAFPDYQKRLAVLPGLTGLAQIQLPPDTDLESVRRKLAYDLYYIERRTLWLDLRILVGTACKVLAIPFCVPRLLLQLPCGAEVENRTDSSEPAEAAAFVPPSFSSVS